MNAINRLITVLAPLLAAGILSAQPSLERPRTSPGAWISQKVGVTGITVKYHRPGVKGRVIWGGLVPFDVPWRTGANEVTTIEFTDPVTVEGKPLAAGTYGLFTIPRKGPWTVVFSSNTTVWGTDYDSSKDVMRIDVAPLPSAHAEWMEFGFSGLSDTAGTLELRWEKLTVPVRIGVNTVDIVLGHARKEFSAGADTGRWQMLRQAAGYAYSKRVHLDEALGWIDRSLAANRNFASLCMKSDILAAAGDAPAASALLDEAIAGAKEKDVTSYARTLGFDGRYDRAIAILGAFGERNGDSWAVHRALGEAYNGAGDREKALSHLNEALGGAPDDAAKSEIRKSIETISSKK